MLEELRIAEDLARTAGTTIASALGSQIEISRKSAVDLVTEIDRKAEAQIVDGLERAFPGVAIVAEERYDGSRPSGAAWLVDPLDGTVNFVHGLAHCSVSIALLDASGPLVAVVHDPCKSETFCASRGGGANLNGHPIRASQESLLADALLVTGFPYDRKARLDFYLAYFRAFIARARDLRRLGSAALDLCYVAAGRFDGFWEWGLHPWDTAAGWLVLTEAGGLVSDFDGSDFDPWLPRILATNGRIHDEALAVLAELAPHV